MWPTRPETGFGYIQMGKELGKSQGVAYHRKEDQSHPLEQNFLKG
jgi:mannose-1-phosphate guanylyltransferase